MADSDAALLPSPVKEPSIEPEQHQCIEHL